jgi:L-ascorbate metabolism protein UlaG (beta-lactamase superfamily)
LADLPRPDLILLSHAHFDHLDVPTLWRIGRRFPDTPVVTAAKTADLLRPTAFCHVVELASVDRQTTTVAGIEITALPVNHWTPRVFADTWRTANAYLLRVGSRSVFFGGDTAMTNHFDAAGPVDLAVLGIGAYNPYVASHATPEQAWAMASAMGARHVAAMHHRTFRLSYEPDAEPLTRLLAAAGEGARHIVIRRPGDVWSADKIAT